MSPMAASALEVEAVEVTEEAMGSGEVPKLLDTICPLIVDPISWQIPHTYIYE